MRSSTGADTTNELLVFSCSRVPLFKEFIEQQFEFPNIGRDDLHEETYFPGYAMTFDDLGELPTQSDDSRQYPKDRTHAYIGVNR